MCVCSLHDRTENAVPLTAGIALIQPSLGATFQIPKTDWIATNNFIWGTASYGIPTPPTGDPVTWAPVSQECKDTFATWSESTYVSFVNQAGSLAGACQTNLASLKSLQQLVGGLEPDEPPPPAVQKAAGTALEGFCSEAQTQATAFSAFGTEIQKVAAFIIEFEQAVLAWMPDWFPTAPSASALAQTTGLLQGAWSALADDLEALAVPPEQITTAFLLSLELDAGVLGWSDLGNEAQWFSINAPPLGYNAVVEPG